MSAAQRLDGCWSWPLSCKWCFMQKLPFNFFFYPTHFYLSASRTSRQGGSERSEFLLFYFFHWPYVVVSGGRWQLYDWNRTCCIFIWSRRGMLQYNSGRNVLKYRGFKLTEWTKWFYSLLFYSWPVLLSCNRSNVFISGKQRSSSVFTSSMQYCKILYYFCIM